MESHGVDMISDFSPTLQAVEAQEHLDNQIVFFILDRREVVVAIPSGL